MRGVGLSHLTRLAAAAAVCAAVCLPPARAVNTAWCWGSGENGALGNAGAYQKGFFWNPLPVEGEFVQIVTGRTHTCGLLANGSATCWGDNSKSQLGSGSKASPGTPVLVAGGHTFVQLSTQEDDTVALDSSGQAWWWGEYEEYSTPANLSSPVPFVQLAVGRFSQICGLAANGSAYCRRCESPLGH